MAYSDFDLPTLRREFGLIIAREPLFPNLEPIAPTTWLIETLNLTQPLVIDSEKARSELLITPILLAVRQIVNEQIAIYSGHTLNSDRARGLYGECDFLLTRTPPLPTLSAPIMTVVEAKRENIEGGLGQCAAQMLGARLFNQQEQIEIEPMFGCVTTGEIWQFLQLSADRLVVDQDRYYIVTLDQILGVFRAIVDRQIITR